VWRLLFDIPLLLKVSSDAGVCPSLQAIGSGACLTSPWVAKAKNRCIYHASNRSQETRPRTGTLTNSLLIWDIIQYCTIYTKINARAHKYVSTIFYPVGTIQTDQEIVRIMRRTGFFSRLWIVPRLQDGRGINFTAALAISQLCGAAEKYQVLGPRRWTKEIEKHDLEPKPSTVYISSLQLYIPYRYEEISWQ